MEDNKNPLISVIMSAFNNELFIRDAIISIQNQTYENIELIITDDCSTDNTLKIIMEFAKNDNRVKVIKNHINLGLTKSLNNMLNIAKGEFIARMDGDDIAFPTRLEKQYEVFKKNNIDFVFSNTKLIDFNGLSICNSYRPKLRAILKILHIHNYIPHPTVLFKKNLIDQYGTYSEKAVKCEDQELWIRFKNNNVRFYFLNEPLLYYRINPNSVRKSSTSKYYKIASMCIVNKNRLKAFKYFKHLNTREKIITIIKMVLPRETMYLKTILKSKFR